MKEIWIEKLVELLNEYEPRIAGDGEHYDNIWWYRHFMSDKTVSNNATRYIVSKEYWFIKWLVENDKISNDWIKPRTDLVKEITIVDYKTGDVIWWKNKYTEVEQLIMYLSIQDEPIRFLCKIIK